MLFRSFMFLCSAFLKKATPGKASRSTKNYTLPGWLRPSPEDERPRPEEQKTRASEFSGARAALFPHDVGTANLSLRPGFVSVRPVRLRLVLNARALLNLVADIVRRRHVDDKNLVAISSLPFFLPPFIPLRKLFLSFIVYH